MSQTVLITGGAGFIGSHLANELLAHGYHVRVLDVLAPKDSPDYDPTEDLRALEGLWIEKLQAHEPTGYHPRPK